MCCISVHITTAQMFPSSTILVLDRLFNEGFFSRKQLVRRKTYSSSQFIFSSTLSLTNSFTQIPSPPSLYKHSTSPPPLPGPDPWLRLMRGHIWQDYALCFNPAPAKPNRRHPDIPEEKIRESNWWISWAPGQRRPIRV